MAELRATQELEYRGEPHGGPSDAQAGQSRETLGSGGVCGEMEFRRSRTNGSHIGQGGLHRGGVSGARPWERRYSLERQRWERLQKIEWGVAGRQL